MASVLTVELDDAADSTLQALAASWHLDPREAIKKAVSVAASTLPAKHISSPLQAWKQLQEELHLTPEQANVWKHSVAEARR